MGKVVCTGRMGKWRMEFGGIMFWLKGIRFDLFVRNDKGLMGLKMG
jgi:hypothetical protein